MMVLDVNCTFLRFHPGMGTNTTPDLRKDEGRNIMSEAYFKCFFQEALSDKDTLLHDKGLPTFFRHMGIYLKTLPV